MRAYFFTNFYLSSIQKGIQAQHCTAELFTRYNRQSKGGKILYDWANNHKTTIILNGGNCKDLKEIFINLRSVCDQEGIPYGSFNEDEQSLNNAITCVGVIATTRIVDIASLIRGTPVQWGEINNVELMPPNVTFVEYMVATMINSCGLAS